MSLRFTKLNRAWNAEPNAPVPTIEIVDGSLRLSFYVNAFRYRDVEEKDVGHLTFLRCARYRLGATNDEGWWRGQCRYSGIAPAWGDFYEVVGVDPLRDLPRDWQDLSGDMADIRHFLFYLRDETFECLALGWHYEVERGATRFKQPAASALP